MPNLTVFTPRHDGISAAVYKWEPVSGKQPPTVLELLRENGATISAPCGGCKRCGRCAVWLSGCVLPPDVGEIKILSSYIISEPPPDSSFSLRLACAARPCGHCKVYFTSHNTPSADLPESDSPSDGVMGNEVENNAAFPHFYTGYPQRDGNNPENSELCHAYPYKHLNDNSVRSTYSGNNIAEHLRSFRFAFDLGTTTISLRVCGNSDQTHSTMMPDDASHDIVYEKTMLNAQRVYGADVITRIAYSGSSNGLAELHNAVAGQLISMLEDACKRLGIAYNEISEVPVAGNTTMLYLLCGISPEELGRFPYTPSERFGRSKVIEHNGMSFTAYLPYCTGGFTGGDLTCCLTAAEAEFTCNMVGDTVPSFIRCALPEETGGYKNLLLCDLGTNGEIALWSRGEHGSTIYVTSAAAGPALEGGSISCGSGAVTGAVSHIYSLDGTDGRLRLGYDVIGGGEPKSLSGCALLELTAILLDSGIIDETGRMSCGEYHVCPNISITQADIRQLQLAKGAVCAAALRLMEIFGTDSPDAVIITGGLGYRIDAGAVRRTGLLPYTDKLFFTPALAMTGALFCCDDTGKALSERIAGRCQCIELSSDDRFNELFVENMEFPC